MVSIDYTPRPLKIFEQIATYTLENTVVYAYMYIYMYVHFYKTPDTCMCVWVNASSSHCSMEGTHHWYMQLRIKPHFIW